VAFWAFWPLYIYLASVLSVPAAEMKPFLGTEFFKIAGSGNRSQSWKGCGVKAHPPMKGPVKYQELTGRQRQAARCAARTDNLSQRISQLSAPPFTLLRSGNDAAEPLKTLRLRVADSWVPPIQPTMTSNILYGHSATRNGITGHTHPLELHFILPSASSREVTHTMVPCPSPAR
jgi:hypothetical protein